MLLLYPSKLFSKNKTKYFPKFFFKWFSKNQLWGIFVYVKLYYFPKACFIAFLHMYESRVVRFNFYYTFICAYICCSWKVFPLSFQNTWHHPSYWVKPGLSVEGKCWMPLDSYWTPNCRLSLAHGWTGLCWKGPLDLIYPTTSIKGRIRWSRSPPKNRTNLPVKPCLI